MWLLMLSVLLWLMLSLMGPVLGWERPAAWSGMSILILLLLLRVAILVLQKLMILLLLIPKLL